MTARTGKTIKPVVKAPARKKKPKVAKRRHGRPSLWTQKVADEICTRLAQGEPLAQICREDRMPSLTTVWNWQKAKAEFSECIARAREAGWDRIASDALEISNTPLLGVIRKVEDTAEGTKITETHEDMLGHRRLQIETRLKLLAKWDPKRYGDKIEIEHAGQLGLPELGKATDTANEILALLSRK